MGTFIMNEKAIGFLDSGVGGLTVVKQAMKQLPNESIYYIGDNARCPYGPRPAEEIVQFTWELVEFLMEKEIKLLVIACNTATAVALDEIRSRVDIPVVGVILPGSRAAIKYSTKNRIGVIGTKGTIESNVYETTLLAKDPTIKVTSLSCPKFVPLVESNQLDSSIAKKVVYESLEPLAKANLDTLILGCTHYPLLKHQIQNVMGPQVTLVDSGAETVSEVSTLLDYYGISANYSNRADREYKFYTTGSERLFSEIATEWLELDNIEVEQVTV
ncbi:MULTISPECIES: glutamate racemase [unclassified Jeotgalibaca]|uniref:glutamate racemase n=1 Tax=unclassified Jeotgalibaca TaxID=2621505 RepID=UPI003FD2CBF9